MRGVGHHNFYRRGRVLSGQIRRLDFTAHHRPTGGPITVKLRVAKIPWTADKTKFVEACANYGQIIDAFFSKPSKRPREDLLSKKADSGQNSTPKNSLDGVSPTLFYVVVRTTDDVGISTLSWRRTLVSPARVRELSRYDPAAMFTYIVWDYLIILLTIALAQRYHHVITYLAAVMVIGARQAGIASVALHDGAHHLLLRNRRSNDLLAKIILYSLLAPVIGVRLEVYRRRHLAHHLNVNTADDPDYPVFKQWYEASRLRMALLYAQTLLGIGFLVQAFFCFRRLSAIPRTVECLCVAAIVWGLIWNVRAAELFVLYWFVPIATWGLFVNLLRASAEHSTPGSLRDDADFPAVFRTGEIVNSPFDSLFIATRGVNYHLAHHLFPSVPFYRLKKLQRDLSTVEEYRRYSHVTYGYHRYLMEFFGRRPA